MSSSEQDRNNDRKSEPEQGNPPNPTDDQGTSSGIRAEVSIKILLKPDENSIAQHSSLQSLDELSELLRQNQKIEIEDADSYLTIESTNREVATSTDPDTMFSRDPRTNNMIVARNTVPNNVPPPPYYDDGRYYRGYPSQGQFVPVVDATRAPPYRSPSYFSQDLAILFQERYIRHKFVQKVYAILTVQLLITFGFVLLAILCDTVRQFLIFTPWLMWIMTVFFWTIYIALICIRKLRRSHPGNLILLILMTCCMAYMAAYLACWADTNSVLYAFGVTALICFVVTVIACQSWIDVTACGVYLTIAALVGVVFGVIVMISTVFFQSRVMHIVYAGIACLLFSLFLLYDTQQILGGRRIELSPEEYILGALTLYVDIIMIFIDVLTFFR